MPPDSQAGLPENPPQFGGDRKSEKRDRKGDYPQKRPSYLPDIHRTLPQSLDAEKGVLCSALLSPGNVLGECIERLSEVRGELWQSLSHGREQAVVDEIKHIDEQLVALWDEHRAERARIRFGERDEIVRRARQEERLERAA